MIIEDVQITPVAIPAEGLKEEKSDIVCALIIEISTDCGLVGIGESPLLLEEENICVPMHTVIRNNLIGKDACDISKRIRDLSADLELHKLHLQAADRLIRGVESALWDILGKRVGKPLCDVWGGAYRQQIEFAGEVKWQSLPAMKQRASKLEQDGYRTIYLKASGEMTDDVAAVAAVRDGLQDVHVKIRVGAHQLWAPGEAISVIYRLEKYGIELVDQPVIRYNLDALKMVRESVSVPVAGHECAQSMYDVLTVVKKDAADYLYLDGRFHTGYNDVRISAGTAEAAGIQCIYHAASGVGIAFAMDLQMIAATANCTLANEAFTYENLKDDIIIGGKLKRQGPYYAVPQEAGVGVSLDRAKLKKYHDAYMKIKALKSDR